MAKKSQVSGARRPRRMEVRHLAEARESLNRLLEDTETLDRDLTEKARKIESAVGRALSIVEQTTELCRQAIMVGVMADAWTPAQFFEGLWVSRPKLVTWTNTGLPKSYVNGKLCVRPREFFARLDEEASAKPPAKNGKLIPKTSKKETSNHE